MFCRCLALLLTVLLSVTPLLGVAAQAPSCTHCPEASAAADGMHCHTHPAAPEKCQQCASCVICTATPYIQAAYLPAIQSDKDVARFDYLPAHFYRLTQPPLDRPPSPHPA